MSWFLNLTTRAKLLLAFAGMISLLAVTTGTAYRGIAAIQESEASLYREDFADALDLTALRLQQNGVRASLLTMVALAQRTEQEKWHQDLRERAGEIDEIGARLAERWRGEPGRLRRLEELDGVRQAYRKTRDDEVIPLIYAGRTEDARKLILGVQEERYQRLRAIARALSDEASQRAEARIAASEAAGRRAVWVFLLVGALALLAGALAVAALDQAIAGPLTRLSAIATSVAGGDLTVSVPADRRSDEVGALNESFRGMVASLREINSQIRDGASVLAASATEILATTAQVAAGAAETATAVGETTTTVEEVKQTADMSSQKARYVLESAQRAAQVSQGGRKAVEEAVLGMRGIQEQMESIAGSIVKLSEQSRSIGDIIATVNDLAEQSNLLAVNAAVEAAKAGKKGRGFAVVAQEVRSLAEQSRQATAQVRAILNEIQKAMGSAVMATEQGSKAVAAGASRSSEAGESIRMLADSSAEAAQAASQIAASSQQQVVGVDQVALAMQNIRLATTQNVASTKQAEAAAQELSRLGRRLKDLVERYRL